MGREVLETSSTPHITVTECLGDLVLRGSDEPQIALHLRDRGLGEAGLEREGETFTLTARDDCKLTCPVGTTLTVHVVRGDLKIEGIRGPVAIDQVYGDVRLRNLGPVALQQAYGDVSIHSIQGDLQAQSILSDARIRAVTGRVSLDQVGSDLRADGIEGGLVAEQVGADAALGPPFTAGATYRLHVGSDLSVTIPPDASLRLALQAGGGVRSRLPDLELEAGEGSEMTGVLGDGEAELVAEVGGRVVLRPEEPGSGVPDLDFLADLEGLGPLIEAQMTERMADMMVRLEDRLGRIDDEAIRRQVDRAAERARRAAERATEKVQRVAEREAERALLRAERADRRWRRASGLRQTPARPSPVSNDERLRVLRMVEEGKLSPQEAADLLDALESG